MAITTALASSFRNEALQGTHAAADTYKIALYTSTATMDATTAAYSATNEVSGTGYTAGGLALTGYSVITDTGVAVLTFSNPSWASSTISARGALIYNSSKTNKAVVILDFGAVITDTNGTFSVTFPAQTAAAGLVRF